MTPPNLPLKDRLFKYVRRTRGCWLWTGGKISTGYGLLRINKKGVLAHRLSWELYTGQSIPDGMCVLHLCDTPACVKPAHLFLGTKADNVADMDRKGRRVNKQPSGEQNGNRKLTTDQVREIRERYDFGQHRPTIATVFGISLATVYSVGMRKTWRHVA